MGVFVIVCPVSVCGLLLLASCRSGREHRRGSSPFKNFKSIGFHISELGDDDITSTVDYAYETVTEDDFPIAKNEISEEKKQINRNVLAFFRTYAF